MERKNVRIALYQMRLRGHAPDKVCMETLGEIERGGLDGVDILCLPELWAHGLLDKADLDSAHCTPEILFRLESFATKARMAIACGLPEVDEGAKGAIYYNSAYFISEGKAPQIYRKVHLFPPFKEDRVFRRGKGPSPIWHAIRGHEVGLGLIICYDLRFPELTREYVLRGCNLIICHALWPKERIYHFKTLLRARAMENQCFVVGINAVGESKGIVLGGGSCVMAPDGTPIVEAGTDEEGIFQCEIDLGKVTQVRERFFTARPRMWQRCASDKVLTLDQLIEAVKRRQRAGQRCVFTNGCFDILHAGHVAYLEEARQCGDFLVVGMNSDESVRAIKGPFRPINPEALRASVLAGLESVDYVVLFDDSTPIRLIERIEPDCLVKGADWDEDEIVGSDFVKARGGEVKRIPFVHDVSTSKIIGKIIKGQR